MTGLDDDLSNVGERGWAGGAKEFISDKGFCQPALTAGVKGGERFGGNVECSMGLDVLQREREIYSISRRSQEILCTSCGIAVLRFFFGIES